MVEAIMERGISKAWIVGGGLVLLAGLAATSRPKPPTGVPMVPGDLAGGLTGINLAKPPSIEIVEGEVAIQGMSPAGPAISTLVLGLSDPRLAGRTIRITWRAWLAPENPRNGLAVFWYNGGAAVGSEVTMPKGGVGYTRYSITEKVLAASNVSLLFATNYAPKEPLPAPAMIAVRDVQLAIIR